MLVIHNWSTTSGEFKTENRVREQAHHRNDKKKTGQCLASRELYKRVKTEIRICRIEKKEKQAFADMDRYDCTRYVDLDS